MTDMTKAWDDAVDDSRRILRGRRAELLGDLCELVNDLGEGKVIDVGTDLNYIHVHFFDEEDKDIGNLYVVRGLHALNSDVFLWPEGSTEEDENGEPLADLNIKEAVRLELKTH